MQQSLFLATHFSGLFMRSTTTIITLTLISLSMITPVKAQPDKELKKVRQAVVKIYTTTSAPDYFTPWSMLNASQSSGSGSMISGNRILTNAHVIADASFIQVQRQGDSRKYNAKASFVAHEADLAILTVDDENFFDDSTPLKFGKLPNTLEPVRVYGFPIGGKTLSTTKGVLSRVEHQRYSHGNGRFLAGQIDAAINPGNSGGPVVANGKIVGVVMQANYSDSSENLGYFVPPSVIQHVLEDIEDGQYDGFRKLGFYIQSMESPAMKSIHGIKPEQTGVVVTHVLEGSPSDKRIQVGDVILKIDDYVIADDETINFRDDQRTSYKYAIDQYQFDEDVEITLMRDGKDITVSIPPGNEFQSASLVRAERFGELPEYYIYGGVLFVPLNMNLIKRWGKKWRQKAPIDFLQQRYKWTSKEREESVVALTVLPAEVNLGYHNWSNWIIDKVNGESIKNFAHLASVLHNNKQEYVIISDKDGYQLAINHQQAISSRDAILKRYRIPTHHSKGLFE
ncbi:MAG: S1C family serine protease [Arenicella sp.]